MIVYFSGTGNSRSVAFKLGREGEKIVEWNEDLAKIEDERLGIVFPVYCGDMPAGLIGSLRRAKISAKYVFAVATAGDSAGRSLNSAAYLMREKGLKLDYAACLKMPDSCIMFPTPEAEKRKLLDSEEERVSKIASELESHAEKTVAPKKPFGFGTRAMWYLFRRVAGKIAYKSAGEECVKCMLCVNECPVKNIEIKDGAISFKGACEDCYRCIQSCPVRAIRFGKLKVTDKTYYKHP